MDKKEKIKKKFNLTFIDDIKEFDYYTVKLINALFFIINEFYSAATKIGIKNKKKYLKKYFNEFIDEIKNTISTNTIIKNKEETEVYNAFEEINTKIEEEHIEGTWKLEKTVEALKENDIIDDFLIFYMYEGYDEEFSKETVKVTKQFLTNNIEQKEENVEKIKELLSGIENNYIAGEVANFFLKFNTKEEYEHYLKIIKQNEMTDYNDIGLEVDEQLKMFEESNILTFRYTTHIMDFSMCINQSELFAAFPMSIFQVKKVSKEINDELIKKNKKKEI